MKSQFRQSLRLAGAVEEEFINTLRGVEQVKFTTFEDGLKYMQFTEAVSRSADSGVLMNVQHL
jgi:hypothetical protein